LSLINLKGLNFGEETTEEIGPSTNQGLPMFYGFNNILSEIGNWKPKNRSGVKNIK
jgi:hypothetical protein